MSDYVERNLARDSKIKQGLVKPMTQDDSDRLSSLIALDSPHLTQAQHRDECVNLLTYPHYWALTDVELEEEWGIDHSTINRWRMRARKRLRDDERISPDRKTEMNELIESRRRVLRARDKNGKRQTRTLNGEEPEIDSTPTDGNEKKVPLDKVWSHEDNFTIWLEENIDKLNDKIGLSLSVVGRKHLAGDFIIDLVAQDESGNFVVIENQLKRSDHDHLGKLIYLFDSNRCESRYLDCCES